MTVYARRSAMCILWILALWNSWECRALFSDGSTFFVGAVGRNWFHSFGDQARQYAIGISQLPLVIGLRLGVTDLHWLARLYSIGVFALPTALYQLALMRAKDDAVLLASVLAAIATVFLTTSFFIVGEYNTAYATAIAAATWLAAARRPRLIDGFVLVGLAVLALRSYEVFLYLGPLLAAMIVHAQSREPIWRGPSTGSSFVDRLLLMGLPIFATGLAFLGLGQAPVFAGLLVALSAWVTWRRPHQESLVADALFQFAAALFLAAAVVAVHSCVSKGGAPYMASLTREAFGFWRNIQFDFALGAALILVVWSVARPADLLMGRPYGFAVLPLIPLALVPLLALSYAPFPPLGTLNAFARTNCGLVIATIVSVIWMRKTGIGARLPVLAVLEAPEAKRGLVGFFFLMLLTLLPSEILMTTTWAAFLETTRATVRAGRGAVAFEAVPPAISRYYWCCNDAENISTLSLALRSRPEDGVIALPRGLEASVPLLDLGKYFWRD